MNEISQVIVSHYRILRVLIALGVATIIAIIEQPAGWGPVVIFSMWFSFGLVEMVVITRARRGDRA